MNEPQKIEKIHKTIYELRFPLYTKARKIWNETASRVNPDPSHVFFTPCPGFEKDRLDIKISIGRAPSARKIFEKLASTTEKDWQELIYPVSSARED